MSQAPALAPAADSSSVELVDRRDYNTSVWSVQEEVKVRRDDGTEETQNLESRVIEKGSGICYRDAQGNFQPSNPHWEPTPDGFVLRECAYGLSAGKTLAHPIVYTTRGDQLRFRPAFLKASSGSTAKVIATPDTTVAGIVDPEDPRRLVFPGRGEPSAPGWHFTSLSYLLPDQPRYPALRNDGGASAASGGVSWAADSPESGEALAFWDRSAISYLTPIDPVPPDWPWGSVGSTSLFGSAIAFTLSDSWPPDAGPVQPRYTYTEIFRLDGQGLARITWDHASWRAFPSLHQRGIAWQVRSAENASSDDWEIEFWDGTSVIRVTDNELEDTGPSLYEAALAWCSGGSIVYLPLPPPGDPGPLPPPVVVGPGEAPSLFGNKIAYHASDGHDAEIFLFDILSGQTTLVTDNDYDDTNPSLYDGTVAWQAYPLSREAAVFYWDGVTTHQIATHPFLDEVAPSLWGTGLNATVAYAEASTHATPYGSYIICARRGVLSVRTTPNPGETTITWPSLEGRAYRVEYSDDLVNWNVAADAVPSAGYGETCWTDGPASGTTPSPSEVSQRFYRVCESQ